MFQQYKQDQASFAILFLRSLYHHLRTSNKIIVFASLYFILVVLLAIFADFVTPHDAYKMNIANRLMPPDSVHLLGTDNFGRDILSRIIMGSRISLLIGITVAFISTFVGTVIGLVSAVYRKFDIIIMRIIDGFMAFPPIILALSIVAIFGAGIVPVIIALSIVYMPRTTRIVRSIALTLREENYVEAALISGASYWYITFTHILPNTMGPVLVQATFIMALSILIEAALSFLGLGVPLPTITWGNMLGEGRDFIRHAWWFITFPGIALILLMMSINLLGDALRDRFDPRII